MTTMSKELYQEIRAPYWSKHGEYQCNVKQPSEWSIAPTSWASIDKLLGIAGIVTPDATGESSQFEEISDDRIAGYSATSSSPAPEAASRPIAQETAASSSSGKAVTKGMPPSYADVLRQQSASPPNLHGQAQGKGKGKAKDKEGDADEKASWSSRQTAETYTIDENPPPSFMKELPIVSVDMGGVLSDLGTHELDKAALAAMEELGNVVGDDHILLSSFVKSNYGYDKTGKMHI